MLRDPLVLVLDEATASIDSETDALLQKMVRTRFKNKTVLTIAHRLDTIMDSDKILVLDAGVVAEFGTPAELLEKDPSVGAFSSLVHATGEASAEALTAMVRNKVAVVAPAEADV